MFSMERTLRTNFGSTEKVVVRGSDPAVEEVTGKPEKRLFLPSPLSLGIGANPDVLSVALRFHNPPL